MTDDTAERPSDDGVLAIEAFRNFLSWGEPPGHPAAGVIPNARRVPPAWYAYAHGHTKWCPPKDEM